MKEKIKNRRKTLKQEIKKVCEIASRYYKEKERFRKIIKLIRITLSAIAFIFLILEHFGVIDYFRHIPTLEKVSANLSTSYAEVKRQYRPSDKEWDPLLELINKYSSVNVPKNKEPKIIGRWQAVSSGKVNLGNGEIAEWTAPSTPVVLLYKDPNNETLGQNDFIIVGTIGDLEEWIVRYKSDFHFMVDDLILGILILIVGGLAIL